MAPPPPLPPLVVVTDISACRGRPLLEVVASAVEGGARAVLVRDKHLPRAERVRLAEGVRQLLDAAGGGVLLASSDPTIAADGVHLASADPWPGAERPRPALTGRSCHSAADLAAAAAEGCDYAFYSPVFPTPSKPGYGPALRPAALTGAPLPVWALGGITSGPRAAECLGAGASGVAVMGAVMGAADPAATVSSLLQGLAGSPTAH